MNTERRCPPVLLVVFRRPDLAEKMLYNICKANPPRVYVACDAARLDHEGEANMVKDTRKVIDSYDGRLTLIKKYNTENQGCAKNMSGSISWFFEHEESGIILEDDCYPDQSFYPFCAELLERYKDDTRVMQIAGYNHYEAAPVTSDDSYRFSYIGWQWGWATWRRAWKLFDIKISNWTEFKRRGLHNSAPFFEMRNNYLNELESGINIDTWAYPWHGCMAMNGGLSVVPIKSLVQNIGVGYKCTHGTESNDGKAEDFGARMHSMEFPLRHPPVVFEDVIYDAFIKRYRKISLYKRVRTAVGKFLRKHGLRK